MKCPKGRSPHSPQGFRDSEGRRLSFLLPRGPPGLPLDRQDRSALGPPGTGGSLLPGHAVDVPTWPKAVQSTTCVPVLLSRAPKAPGTTGCRASVCLPEMSPPHGSTCPEATAQELSLTPPITRARQRCPWVLVAGPWVPALCHVSKEPPTYRTSRLCEDKTGRVGSHRFIRANSASAKTRTRFIMSLCPRCLPVWSVPRPQTQPPGDLPVGPLARDPLCTAPPGVVRGMGVGSSLRW